MIMPKRILQVKTIQGASAFQHDLFLYLDNTHDKLLLAREEHTLLAREAHLPLAREEDLLPAQEEDLLLTKE